jgi:outer membrane protein assembly factor BamD
MRSFKKALILVILSLFLVACSDSDDPVKEETKGWSVQRLYAAASTALGKKSYSRAIKLYDVLESTYPYGVYAQQGLLDLAYAYYQNDQPELALPTIDQFITTYPTNVNMDYALYFKGYINYKNDNGLLSGFTGQDLAERDPKGVHEAFNAFTELVNRYPNSRFTPDAKDKINRLVNALSRGELYRARYYMSIGAYVAAIGRAQNVIANYPNTPQVEESLAIQEEAYKKLGQVKLAGELHQVIVINFPHSEYINHEWKNNDIAWFAFWR